MNKNNFMQVDLFAYLGTSFAKDGNKCQEIGQRTMGSHKEFFAVLLVIKSRKIDRKSKLDLYNILILRSVFYGCETWTIMPAF